MWQVIRFDPSSQSETPDSLQHLPTTTLELTHSCQWMTWANCVDQSHWRETYSFMSQTGQQCVLLMLLPGMHDSQKGPLYLFTLNRMIVKKMEWLSKNISVHLLVSALGNLQLLPFLAWVLSIPRGLWKDFNITPERVKTPTLCSYHCASVLLKLGSAPSLI